MKVLIRVFVIAIGVTFLFSSCKKEDSNPTTAATGAKTMTMNHWGVDFSEGVTGSAANYLDQNKVDGDVINWCEYSTGGTNYYGLLLAFRPNSNKMYKVTSSDLAGVTTIDTSKWNSNVDCGSVKLVPNDIWVIKAVDGYVAFKVLEAAQDSATIAANFENEVKVEYKFSSTLNF